MNNESSESLDKISSFRELTARISLRDVVIYDLYGRAEAGFKELEPFEDWDGDEIEKIPEDSYQINWHVALRKVSDELGVRARLEVQARDGQYRADGAIFYSIDPPVEVNDEIYDIFAERVGFLALYPYLRQAVQDITSRIPVDPIVLPMIRAGEIRFEPVSGNIEYMTEEE